MFRKFLKRRGALIFVPNSIQDTEKEQSFTAVTNALSVFGSFLNYPMVVLGADDNKWKIVPIEGNWLPRPSKKKREVTPIPRPKQEAKEK
jgi:hypothetical protein